MLKGMMWQGIGYDGKAQQARQREHNGIAECICVLKMDRLDTLSSQNNHADVDSVAT